jgi:hypothetical protein
MAAVDAGYALVKLEGLGRFSPVPLLPGDSVALLLDRACAKYFALWGVVAAQADLHLVAPGGQEEEPSEAAVAAAAATSSSRLGVGLPLGRAGVTCGAWLLVRVCSAAATAAAAAGGHCSAAADPVALLAAYHAAALPEREAELLRHHDAFEGDRSLLSRRAFTARHAVSLLRRLQCFVASTTRRRLASTTGIVLDGPLGGAQGRAGTSIMLALLDGGAFCAKVGLRASLEHEWRVSQAIHARSAAPTVARALALEAVPASHASDSASAQGLLLLPLYALSVATARVALAPELTAAPGARLRCRDALAARVAVCTLAAIAAFARAGWAHGDIKPGNIMICAAGGSSGGSGSGSRGAPCVLIDFGAAQPVGQALAEFSHFGLEFEAAAGLAYDLACLASTLAVVQYDLPLDVGRGSSGALLAVLGAMDAAASAAAAAATAPATEAAGAARQPQGRPPGSLAAELCALLARRACAEGGVGEAELRGAAEAVAEAGSWLGLPSLEALWPRDHA